MSNRRDVIFGAGASLATVLGTAYLGLRALGGRERTSPWRNDASPGAALDELQPFTLQGCTPGKVTAQQTEGPFYTPKSPQRRDIRDFGVAAQPLVVRGRVLDSRCEPIAGAILDFWQTGHDGSYDQHGYRYRGYQYTDSHGRFELVTVRPHAYTAMSLFRTPHIHAKVQGRTTSLLTTQLYLPDAEENSRDLIYDPLLNLAYAANEGDARIGRFDFVLADA